MDCCVFNGKTCTKLCKYVTKCYHRKTMMDKRKQKNGVEKVMELKNVKITKIGNKDKPSAYLPLKRKIFISNGLSFDKTYDVELVFKEVEAKPEITAEVIAESLIGVSDEHKTE